MMRIQLFVISIPIYKIFEKIFSFRVKLAHYIKSSIFSFCYLLLLLINFIFWKTDWTLDKKFMQFCVSPKSF